MDITLADIDKTTTNGDVIKSLFPGITFVEDEWQDEDGVTWTDITNGEMTFSIEWWNSAYTYSKGGTTNVSRT